MERKLAAIFAADVVGYGRLMERDEAGTFARLRAHRKELFEPEIERHHGRIFKLMGDGLLAEFGSVVDAVECAVVLQREMVERNNGLPDDERIDVRMGVHLGDVIVEGDDRHGDAVNIAARLQQLAEPSGICVSETVVKHVKQKVALRFESQGEERLKSIAEPVAVYRVEIGAMATQARVPSWFARLPRLRLVVGAVAILLLAAGGVAAWYLQPREPPPKSFPSIAVLPFDNFSGDPAQDYLSDGVSEEIITMLSRFPDLAVIARNSTFTYKGRPVDIRQVGRDLGVDYVVEGSVRKEADKLRIVAQLVDARTGQHVWAERYENAGSDPWLLQDEVTGKIIGSLTGEQGLIRKKEYDGAWGKDAGSLQEHDYYLRGHDIFINAETKEDHNRAGEIWNEGLRKFPSSSLLRVKLGFFYFMRAYSFWSDDAAADYRRAGEFGREAQSTPNLSPQVRRLGHWLMAFVFSQEGDFDRALAETDAAIALAPYDAYMLGTLSNIPMMAGKPTQAIEWIEKAMVRDPQDEKPNNFRLGRAYYLQGDYEKALSAINKGSPPWVDVPLFLASIYVRLDRMEEARAEVKKALVMEPGFTQAKWREAWFYKDASILDRQLADLGKAGLPEK